MGVEHLSIRGFRNLDSVDISAEPGINWLAGDNGAGKTSVLEALHVLARGRSFRAAQIGAVIGHQTDSLMVVAHVQTQPSAPAVVMGVERDASGWRGRIAGHDSHRVSDFARQLPVVLIEPDSHRLVSDGPQGRRQYLDWLLFHVEPDYLAQWQRYQRLLKQRNAALKTGEADHVLDALEAPLIAAGEALNTVREVKIGALGEAVSQLSETLGLRLPGPIDIKYRPGHASDKTLAQALADSRDTDRETGFTRAGPHRADLVLRVAGFPAAQESSRGQQKLLATLLLLAHWRQLTEHAESAPVLLLDDPVSELDQGHLNQLLAWLREQPHQVWITATQPGPTGIKTFHVEQGQIQSVV